MSKSSNADRRAMIADALRLSSDDLEKLNVADEQSLVEVAMALILARKYFLAAQVQVRRSISTLPTNHPLFDMVLTEMQWILGCAALATPDSRQRVRVVSNPDGTVRNIDGEFRDLTAN